MLYNPRWDSKELTLDNLIYILRHKELWPKDFKWNYLSPSCCAIGLARNVFNTDTYDYITLGKMIGLTINQADKAFMGGIIERMSRLWFGATPSQIPELAAYTPEMVADILEGFKK